LFIIAVLLLLFYRYDIKGKVVSTSNHKKRFPTPTTIPPPKEKILKKKLLWVLVVSSYSVELHLY